MGRCTSWLGWPWNWDSVLSYSTVKIVQIQDKRLGLLHYFFMLCILGYVVGYTVLWQMRYLREEVPIGSIRTSLMSPQTKGIIPPPAQDIDYCLQHNSTKDGFPNYECVFWDESFVVFPILEPSAMFIATRVTNSSQELENNCDLTVNTCKYANVAPPNNVYIADIENFTLLIDHAMYTSQLGYQANGQDLPGSLLDQNGNKITSFPPGDQVGVIGKQDIMHISMVLEAAGIYSLDTPGLVNKTLSKRDEGLVLLIFITYSNTFSYNTNSIDYEITVEPVTDTKFKSEQPIYDKDYQSRVIWNRHGLRLLLLPAGVLGKFDFQTLLLSLVSGLGLLAAATLIVDVIAIRLMPGRGVYRRYKYQETPLKDETQIDVSPEVEAYATLKDDEEVVINRKVYTPAG